MIEAIIVDCDGVLTDGGMYYNADGLAFKKFNTRDFAATWRLKEAGLKWYAVTAADDAATRRRIDAMNPEIALYNTSDKLQAVREICMELEGYDLSEVAYIGDDVMDIPAMKAVGKSYCPADAAESVLQIGFCCTRKGGEGVFAEVVDRVIETNRIELSVRNLSWK